MITSTKNYTKKAPKNQKTDRQNSRTNVKAKLYRQKSQKETYTYILTKREKGKKIYIYKKRKRATKSIKKSTNDNKL